MRQRSGKERFQAWPSAPRWFFSIQAVISPRLMATAKKGRVGRMSSRQRRRPRFHQMIRRRTGGREKAVALESWAKRKRRSERQKNAKAEEPRNTLNTRNEKSLLDVP